MRPLISVVLPVYNCELYIYDAIMSIIKQTVINFQIIVIDDASTDSTVEVIKSIQDDRIFFIQNEKNFGLIHCLNLGFDNATGKYIARMDGDDISLANRFEKQLAVLENNKKIIFCSNWIKHFGENDKIIKHKEFHCDIFTQLLLNCSTTFGTAMFRADIFKKYRFSETKKHVEDYDFISRTITEGQFYNIQEVLYLYRTHKNQISTVFNCLQKEKDIEVKLFLFKKLNYNEILFTDQLIAKVLLFNDNISTNDLKLFYQWLNDLKKKNLILKFFPKKEFNNVLKTISRNLIFSIYFKQNNIGIDKKWRIKAIQQLPLSDLSYLLKLKFREITKRIYTR